MIPNSNHFYMELFQPMVKLNEKCNSLRQIHKLTIPLNMLLMAQKLFKLLTINKLCQHTTVTFKNCRKLFRNRCKEVRIMCFRIGTFLTPQHLFRQPVFPYPASPCTPTLHYISIPQYGNRRRVHAPQVRCTYSFCPCGQGASA